MQSPGQALSQQTLSTQAPEPHWVLLLQVAPLPPLVAQVPPAQ
jgi:hypothetical protein